MTQKKASAVVSGLEGERVSTVSHLASFSLGARGDSTPRVPAPAYVMRRITDYTPPVFDSVTFPNWGKIELADPSLNPAKQIDLLIGADLFPKILLDGVKTNSSANFVAQKTIFGWIISSTLNQNNETKTISVNHASVPDKLNDSIQRFWEIENVPKTTFLTESEQACEAHFVSTVTRDKDGRCTVRLPFNTD